MMFPRYLLMDTFCLIAIIMIYLSFLNPDFYMEGRTWIFNSKALRDYLQEINGKKLYSIFAFTIHNFRDISQIYGSKQMEQGIHLICNYLRRNFPEQKLFYCRSGRFAILFEKNYDEERICRQLNKRFGKSWKSEGTEIYADIGCAILDSDMTKLPFETLMILIGTAFSEADKADRFEIKHIGEEHAKHAQREFEIKKAIELAVDNNTAELFLQPIVDARTEIIVGAEALARIRDNEGNIISPELFIPIAEQNGRINQLGSQVFKKVCDFIVNNDMKKLGLSWINVNLSPIQFMRPTLGKDLVVTLQDYDIPHKFLHLEITEAAMADEQLLINQANLINELGFNFVLDDYGKGYSNITRLKNCPFVNVKLDMNIVWDHCARPDEVIPNMVRTFLNMGFEITAEGIEDEAMAKTMQDVGCTYLQGFYYAKPMPAQEFVKKYLKN
jgi:EAL domain-containing protein (putative c-di-GMP-specific phosphodiesterase class I)